MYGGVAFRRWNGAAYSKISLGLFDSIMLTMGTIAAQQNSALAKVGCNNCSKQPLACCRWQKQWRRPRHWTAARGVTARASCSAQMHAACVYILVHPARCATLPTASMGSSLYCTHGGE